MGDRSRGRWWIAYLLALVVAVAGAGWYGLRRHDQHTAPATTADALVDKGFAVTLSVNGPHHGTVVMGSTLQGAVEAISAHPVRYLELWDGAHRVQQVLESAKGVHLTVRWQALSAGEHVLFGRAVDDTGAIASSSVVTVDVLFPAGRKQPVRSTVPVTPGETVHAVADRLVVPASDVQVVGRQAQVTVPIPTRTDGDGDHVVVTTPPATGSGPELTVTPSSGGCGVTTSVSGAGGPVTLADARSGQGGFRITKQTSLMVPGVHVLMAKTAKGESTPVQVTVPQSCLKQVGWKGDVSLVGSTLTLPKPVAHGYAYVGVPGKPYKRIPADPTQFLTGDLRRVQVDDLPLVSGSALHLESWESKGATATLTGLGEFSEVPGISPADVFAATAFRTDLSLGEGESDHPSQDGKLTFAWTTTKLHVKKVLVQALVSPLPEDNTQLMTPLALPTFAPADEKTPGIDIDPGGTVSSGTISIDTRAVKGNLPGTTNTAFQQLQSALSLFGGSIYVRVLTLDDNGTVLGDASNTVQITLPGSFTTKDAFTLGPAVVLPGHAANEKYAGCVQVTGTHWASLTEKQIEKAAPYGAGDYAHTFYPHDGRYCFPDPGPDSCDSLWCSFLDNFGGLVDSIGDLWNDISTAFDTVISTVVNVIGEINPICQFASGKLKDDCQTVTKFVARAAISAVLTAYGIPPSLPTTGQLKATVKGDLSALGEEVLTELGVPCDSVKLDAEDSDTLTGDGAKLGVSVPHAADGSVDLCKIALEGAMNQVFDTVAQQATDTTAAQHHAVSCPISLCTVSDDPTSELQPPIVNAFAYRTGGPPLDGTPIHVHVTIHSNSGKYHVYPFEGGDAVFYSNAGKVSIAFLVFANYVPYGDIYGIPEGTEIYGSIEPPKTFVGKGNVSGSSSFSSKIGPAAP